MIGSTNGQSGGLMPSKCRMLHASDFYVDNSGQQPCRIEENPDGTVNLLSQRPQNTTNPDTGEWNMNGRFSSSACFNIRQDEVAILYADRIVASKNWESPGWFGSSSKAYVESNSVRGLSHGLILSDKEVMIITNSRRTTDGQDISPGTACPVKILWGSNDWTNPAPASTMGVYHLQVYVVKKKDITNALNLLKRVDV